ncbi:MAG: lipoprotein insertase outer membrane protein LolB [Agarilytica sp.]
MKLFFSLLLCVSLTACVSTPRHPSQHLTPETLRSWTASGKLGIRDRRTAKAINFKWQHSDEHFDIKLHGAMGIGTTRLTNKEGVVTLKNRDGVRTADSAESLLSDVLGWTAPVNELTYWIKGLISPESKIESERRSNEGELEQLNQQGWQIHFVKYHQFEDLKLPKKIVAKRDSLTLTIAIKNWSI